MWFQYCFTAALVIVGVTIVVYTAWAWTQPAAVFGKMAKDSLNSGWETLASIFKKKEK